MMITVPSTLGVFDTKIVIAIVAFTGVVLASIYMLRIFIRAMHNRVGADVESRDVSFREGLVLVPLVAVIIALAFVPQFALKKGAPSIDRAVSKAEFATQGHITVIR